MQGATHLETIPAKLPALKSPRKTIASPSPSPSWSSPPPFYLTPPPPPPLPPPSWFEEHGQYLYEYARELLLVLDLQQGQDDERTLSFNNDGINHLDKHHQILHDTNDSNWHTIHEEIIRTFLWEEPPIPVDREIWISGRGIYQIWPYYVLGREYKVSQTQNPHDFPLNTQLYILYFSVSIWIYSNTKRIISTPLYCGLDCSTGSWWEKSRRYLHQKTSSSLLRPVSGYG